MTGLSALELQIFPSDNFRWHRAPNLQLCVLQAIRLLIQKWGTIHFLYVLVYHKALAATPLCSKISWGPLICQCVYSLCKSPLNLDHFGILVRAELCFCVSEQVLSWSGLKTQLEGQGWRVRAFIVRQQASRALGLYVTNYLKTGFTLPNINLNYTRLDFSFSQQGEMVLPRVDSVIKRLSFAWCRHLRM